MSSTIPADFIILSDDATLKNDARTTASVVFPGSTVVAGNGSAEFHTDVVIGQVGSINRLQIASSKDSGKRYVTKSYSREYTGSLGGYNIFAFASRISTTTIRCSLVLLNPYSSNMTGEAVDETFTFYIDTFIPPFA